MSKNSLGFLFFILAIIVGFVFVWPEATDVRTTTATRDAAKTVETEKAKRYEALLEVQRTFASEQGRVDKIISTLPQEPQIPEVLVTIESMATESGASVFTIAPQTDTSKQQVSVTITGEGELTSIENLVKSFTDNNRPISMTSLSIVRATDAKKLNFTMGLSFPFIPKVDKKEAGI